MDFIKVAYTYYRCGCATNLTGVTTHVGILAYKEDPGNAFLI